MKKKGIALSALLGTIIGIIILISLLILTFKIFNIVEPEDVCVNKPYWEDIKQNLKLLDKKDISFGAFFPNAKDDCQLVTFIPGKNSQVKVPSIVNAKGKPAICLCEKVSYSNCEGLQECYYLDSITDVNVDYNYLESVTKIYYFFTLQEDPLQLNTYSRYGQVEAVNLELILRGGIITMPLSLKPIIDEYLHDSRPSYLFLDFNKNNNVLNIRSSLK